MSADIIKATGEAAEKGSIAAKRFSEISPIGALVLMVIAGAFFICLVCAALGGFLYTVVKGNEALDREKFQLIVRQQADESERFRKLVEVEGEKNRNVFIAQSKANQDLTIKTVETSVAAITKSSQETAKLEQRVNDLTMAVNDLRASLKTMTEAVDLLRKKLGPNDDRFSGATFHGDAEISPWRAPNTIADDVSNSADDHDGRGLFQLAREFED